MYDPPEPAPRSRPGPVIPVPSITALEPSICTGSPMIAGSGEEATEMVWPETPLRSMTSEPPELGVLFAWVIAHRRVCAEPLSAVDVTVNVFAANDDADDNVAATTTSINARNAFRARFPRGLFGAKRTARPPRVGREVARLCRLGTSPSRGSPEVHHPARGGLNRYAAAEADRWPIGSYGRSAGPTYSELGRISRLSPCCSITCAAQPTTRLIAKIGVNSPVSMPR